MTTSTTLGCFKDRGFCGSCFVVLFIAAGLSVGLPAILGFKASVGIRAMTLLLVLQDSVFWGPEGVGGEGCWPAEATTPCAGT